MNDYYQEEYISVYDLLDWAKEKNFNAEHVAAQDILNILREQEIDLYRHYEGIKPRLTIEEQSLNDILSDIVANSGYGPKVLGPFDDDIPF